MEKVGKNLDKAHRLLQETAGWIQARYRVLVSRYGVDEGSSILKSELENLMPGVLRVLADARELQQLVKAFMELDLRSLDREVKRVHDSSYGGSIVVKRIPCGKNCSGCPHGPYAYRVVRVDGKQKWIYLGKV